MTGGSLLLSFNNFGQIGSNHLKPPPSLCPSFMCWPFGVRTEKNNQVISEKQCTQFKIHSNFYSLFVFSLHLLDECFFWNKITPKKLDKTQNKRLKLLRLWSFDICSHVSKNWGTFIDPSPALKFLSAAQETLLTRSTPNNSPRERSSGWSWRRSWWPRVLRVFHFSWLHSGIN